MIELVDTHCHIHEAAGTDDVAAKWHKAGKNSPVELLAEAQATGVTRLICVGCTLEDSKMAVDFANTHDGAWASIGLHPHEAEKYVDDPKALAEFADLLKVSRGGSRGGAPAARSEASTVGEVSADRTPPAKSPKIVAIGECGLDYYYNHSPKDAQQKILRFQLDLAQKHNLPVIFHVREAFDDFWPIFDEYTNIRGVIHSFTATEVELAQILKRGLYVGLNGIMTFTKHVKQLDAAKAVPLSNLLLETDAPFLTPQPFRDIINAPKFVQVTAEFLAKLRGETLEQLAKETTANAQKLFGL